jgi:hypothetical protein
MFLVPPAAAALPVQTAPIPFPPPHDDVTVVGLDGLRVLSITPERIELATLGDTREPAVDIALALRGTALAAVHVESWLPAAPRRFVGKLGPLPLSEARTLVRLSRSLPRLDSGPRALERIEEPERLHRALHGLVNARARGWTVGPERLPILLFAYLERPEKRLLLLSDQPFAQSAEVEIEVAGPLSLFQMRLRVTHQAPGLLCTELPSEILRTRRRNWLRTELAGAQLAVRHPWFENDIVRLDVTDASHGGLGLTGEGDELLLYPGLEFPEVELWKHGRRIDGPYRGVIRHAREDGAGAALLDSVRAISASSLVYPRTTVRPEPTDMWDLFLDSGYLALGGRSSAELSPERSAFLESADRLRAAPDVGVMTGWPASKGLDGSITMVRLYESAWMAFHLAKISGPSSSGLPGKLVLRELHRQAYEHVLSEAGTRYLLSYVRDDAAGWPRLMGVEFATRNAAAGHTFVESERAYLVSCRAGENGGASVRSLTDPDAFLTAVRAQHSAEFCEAYDYLSDELGLARIGRRWERAGLQRARTIIEVENEQGESCFAVAECTSAGTHVYQLFDSARLYGGHCDAITEERLLQGVSAWFLAMGRRSFVLFRPAAAPLLQRGARDMGAFTASLIPTAIAPDYLEHLWEITSAQLRA